MSTWSGVWSPCDPRRSTTSRSRASSSAGPAVSRTMSSTVHSADSAMRPPSVSTAIVGTVVPIAASTRVNPRATARSRRPSTRITSPSGRSTSAPRPAAGRSPGARAVRAQAGPRSVGCRAAVRSVRSMRAHPRVVRRVDRPITNQGGAARRSLDTIPGVPSPQPIGLTTIGRCCAARIALGRRACATSAAWSRTGSPDRRGRRPCRPSAAASPRPAAASSRSTCAGTAGPAAAAPSARTRSATSPRRSRWLREHGYAPRRRRSAGRWAARSVLRYAGLGGDADAVVSVSSPGRWFERGTRPMRIVHWLCETRTGRVVVRVGRRTRLAARRLGRSSPRRRTRSSGRSRRPAAGRPRRRRPLLPDRARRTAAGRGARGRVLDRTGHGARRDGDHARTRRAHRRLGQGRGRDRTPVSGDR